MAKHLETGRLGEEIALRYLENQGYIIRETNWIHRHKEVDIIAQEGADIVFVEVKTRRSEAYGRAMQAVDTTKRANLIVAANSYMQAIGQNLNARFDIIAIEFDTEGNYQLEHAKRAFYPTAPTSHSRRARFNANRIPKLK